MTNKKNKNIKGDADSCEIITKIIKQSRDVLFCIFIAASYIYIAASFLQFLDLYLLPIGGNIIAYTHTCLLSTAQALLPSTVQELLPSAVQPLNTLSCIENDEIPLSEVVVYIVDTGVDDSDPIFKFKEQSIVTNIEHFSPYTKFLNSNWLTFSGHGTAVAYEIISTYIKMFGYKNPGISIVSLPMLLGSLLSALFNPDLEQYINWIIEDCLDRRRIAPHINCIINLSILEEKSLQLDNAILRARLANISTAAAAGNLASNACMYFPGSVLSRDYNKNIAMAPFFSTGAIDALGFEASFSNYGPCVNVHREGENVVVTHPYLGHDVVTGTSFAAPKVAGEIAYFFRKYGAQAKDSKAEIERRNRILWNKINKEIIFSEAPKMQNNHKSLNRTRQCSPVRGKAHKLQNLHQSKIITKF